jgi:hypothetical protein
LEAHNLFFHLTYEGAVDLSAISDPVTLDAAKEQIAQFGQTPFQLFTKPHPQVSSQRAWRCRSSQFRFAV